MLNKPMFNSDEELVRGVEAKVGIIGYKKKAPAAAVFICSL
jgi:hypothetical protein